MSDIFQEVEADLRREKAAKLWERFGVWIIALAVLIVLIVAGWRGYEHWRVSRERAVGDRYVALLAEAEGARTAGSAEALTTFAADAPEGYALLARLRAATTYEQAGDTDTAGQLLRGVADDAEVPALYRDLARIRLVQHLIDAGDTAGAREIAGPMADDAGAPFSRSAQELMGLAAYADDDLAGARRWFTELSTDVATSSAMRQRAQAMLALLTQVAPDSAAGAVSAVPDGAATAPDASASAAAAPTAAASDSTADAAVPSDDGGTASTAQETN